MIPFLLCFITVHTGGGQYIEPDDAVYRPLRVHQTPAARQVAPEQSRHVSGVRHVGRVDSGRGRVGASIRGPRTPADGRHALDAVLRGVLRGRRVRRTLDRGSVQPAGRQPDPVHHVAQGGRGSRTAAAAHAHHDRRIQTGHTGRVHTEKHHRTVQGKRSISFSNVFSKYISFFFFLPRIKTRRIPNERRISESRFVSLYGAILCTICELYVRLPMGN